MNKILSLSFLMLIKTTTIFAGGDATGIGIGDEQALVTRDMVAITISTSSLEKESQTENATLLQPFEFVGNRERFESQSDRFSIDTQIGLPIKIYRGLHEESIDDVMRKALTDDQMEKMRIMKKRMKYVWPCYCVFLGGWIYSSYFMPR